MTHLTGSRKKATGAPPISAAAFLSMGFTLIASTLAGLYLGTLLDRSRGSALFGPAGLLLGLLAGLHHAYALVKAALKREK